jgi:hypothetical protein
VGVGHGVGPFVLTGVVILGGHFADYTTTVNWAECAMAGVGVAALWLVAENLRSRQTF